MSKGFLWLLLGGGLVLLITGISIGNVVLLILGILALGGGLYLAFGPEGILRKEQVVDDWAALIEGAAGQAEQVFQAMRKHVESSGAPNVAINRRKMAPGVVRGFQGSERDFLVAAVTGNNRLTPYQVFLNARNYGRDLAVDWHLTYRPDFFQALALMFSSQGSARDRTDRLDLFDLQDLRTYTTVCHRSMVKAVEDLMASLNQDTSRLERKSRGFLGIS